MRRLSLLVVAVALAPAAAAGPAAAAPAGEELSLTLLGERPIAGTPAELLLAGTTDAPAGSRVTLLLDAVSHFAEVGEDGSWRIDWPGRPAPGTHLLEATVRAPDGRVGRARAEVVIRPPERLPRRPLEERAPDTVPPAAPADDEFRQFTDRWRIVPPPYELSAAGSRWDPYNQNVLKGDYPIRGDRLFLVLTGVWDTLVEGRALPTAAGISTAATPLEFFGADDQGFGLQTVLLSADLFHGDTAFRPFDWRIKGTVALNLNYVALRENALVKPDVRRGTDRTDSWGALQELFFEAKLADLSPNYDFVSVRVGIQPFNSDFRGFVFDDMNLGVRLFGNLSSNRSQFNLAWFERLEKDTNSGLNTLHLRDQQVGIVNFYRQDFLVRGYTSQWSVHYLRDEPTFHFDDNEFLARPDPVGDLTPHEIEAVYVGWTSFGHIGRWNVDSALYYVTGEDSLNPIAGRQLVLREGEFLFLEKVDISAWMAALELSMDRDWLRPKVAFFWASGDDDLHDRDAGGFDAIFDNPNFAGGGFSFWNRMGIRLASTGVALVNRGSLLPDLRSSKEEGQPNFVNPGLRLGSLGLDLELTPKLKAILTANYLAFDRTEVLEGLLFQGPIDREIGTDLSAGARYRPFLNQNAVLLAGVAGFLPGRGFEQIFERDDLLTQVFATLTLTW